MHEGKFLCNLLCRHPICKLLASQMSRCTFAFQLKLAPALHLTKTTPPVAAAAASTRRTKIRMRSRHWKTSVSAFLWVCKGSLYLFNNVNTYLVFRGRLCGGRWLSSWPRVLHLSCAEASASEVHQVLNKTFISKGWADNLWASQTDNTSSQYHSITLQVCRHHRLNNDNVVLQHHVWLRRNGLPNSHDAWTDAPSWNTSERCAELTWKSVNFVYKKSSSGCSKQTPMFHTQVSQLVRIMVVGQHTWMGMSCAVTFHMSSGRKRQSVWHLSPISHSMLRRCDACK